MKKIIFSTFLVVVISFIPAFVFAQTGKGSTTPPSSGKAGSTTNSSQTGKGSTTPPQSGSTGSTTTTQVQKLEDPLGDGVSLEGLLLKLFEIILYVGVPIVAFFLIWSGFMFITAQGNPEKLETARSRLLYTIIGAMLLLGAWTISQAIKGTIEDIKRGGTALLEKNIFI